MEEKLEILSTELLDLYHPLVEDLKSLARRLGIQLGWHYPLDLVWIASLLDDPSDQTVLDAGAGTGVLQWWLAERGANVISVDRLNRQDLSTRFRLRYRLSGLRPADHLTAGALARRRLREGSGSPVARLVSAGRAALGAILSPVTPKAPGQVLLYHRDLGRLADLPDASVDAVVAVSALEHNPPDRLPQVVEELSRVLRPGGALLATLAAARDRDWYHEPSQGWCYTEATLRHVFRLSPSAPSNFDRYDELFARLVNCGELRDNLADFYFRSGDNGMPWGKWDPQYQPVGIRKVKPLAAPTG